jgi:dihydrofolate reductase
MARLTFDISVSLDGFVAGPDPDLEQPLGAGGEELHTWAFATETFRRQHGLEGGERGVDDDVAAESVRGIGAYLMGRRMFSGGAGGWEDDPRRDGWWGDEPPFHVPVFVLTHHARPPLELRGTTFHFVTEGFEAALDRARTAAAERDVVIAGGASVAQQGLRAGVVDGFQLHVAPTLLGGGTPLFEGVGGDEPRLEVDRVVSSPAATHLRYRVLR